MAPLKSPFSTLPLKNIDEVQKCSELLHRDDICHHVYLILLCTNLHQVNNLFYYNLMTYHIISHINVLCPLVISMILRKMYRTLIVTVDVN